MENGVQCFILKAMKECIIISHLNRVSAAEALYTLLCFPNGNPVFKSNDTLILQTTMISPFIYLVVNATLAKWKYHKLNH